jgi:hypothetical protein
MLRRGIVIGLIVACILACAVGFWGTQASMVAPFVLPDATDIVVTRRGLAGLTIAYQAGGQANQWRGDISRQLAEGGWRGRDYTFGYTQRFIVTWYTRTFVLGPLTILESANVGGDPQNPNVVIVQVHRELHFNR